MLEFSRPDFGGPAAAAVIEEWDNRAGPVREGDFVCWFHREHERPGLYLQRRRGQLVAAHWGHSGLADTHTITHGMTDEHRYQTDYIQRAAEDAGFATEKEYVLPGVRLDAAIFTDWSVTGIEVQRSKITARTARSRTTKAGRSGALSVWFNDRDDRAPWFGRVPSIGMNRRPWDTVPPRYSAVVGSGTGHIKAVRCTSSSGIVCRDRRTGWCGAYHPVREPLRGLFVDNIAEMVPLGQLVPMRFRLATKPDPVIYLVPPDSLRRYEELTFEAAGFAIAPPPPLTAGQRERITCSADAGVKVVRPDLPARAKHPRVQLSGLARFGLDGLACQERARLPQDDPRGPRQRACCRCGRVTARIDGEGLAWCGGEFAPDPGTAT
jgi:hypothetical protein